MYSLFYPIMTTARCHHPPCAQLRTGADDPVRRGRSVSSPQPRRAGYPPSRGM